MSFEFFRPGTFDEALSLARTWGGDGRFIAGGTDLVIQMRKGVTSPAALIDIGRLPGLSDIVTTIERVHIGALVTHRQIERHHAFQAELRGLAESAAVVGGQQVRNLGTVGGNLCNASPAADLAPMLLCLNAQVHASSWSDEYVAPLTDFLLGPRRTALPPGALVTGVSFDAPSGQSATAFLKAGRRMGMEISIVSMAAMLKMDGDRIGDVRIAVGAAGPVPFRAHASEAFLRGQTFSRVTLQEAADLAVAAASPRDDLRASATYRSRIVATYLPRILDICRRRIAGSSSHRFLAHFPLD